jgi:TM2 domain-containing membrane protein YozV
MSEIKEKSVPLAIGLNFLLPGLGYMYMGKVIVGIAALFLIIGIYAVYALIGLLSCWVVMNILMAIDMLILGNKNKKSIEDKTMMKCPECAEMIKNEAKICKHCKSTMEVQPA